jgi:hypothetical protein
MASVTKVHGNYGAIETIGRDIAITTLSKTNITQDELNAACDYIATTNSITAIGTFSAGVTDVVTVITEGPAITAGSDFGVGSTGITSAALANF